MAKSGWEISEKEVGTAILMIESLLQPAIRPTLSLTRTHEQSHTVCVLPPQIHENTIFFLLFCGSKELPLNTTHTYMYTYDCWHKILNECHWISSKTPANQQLTLIRFFLSSSFFWLPSPSVPGFAVTCGTREAAFCLINGIESRARNLLSNDSFSIVLSECIVFHPHLSFPPSAWHIRISYSCLFSSHTQTLESAIKQAA